MNKTFQILLAVTGVGLLIWLLTKRNSRDTFVVPQPVATTTGTMGTIDQFFNAFRRVPTNSIGSGTNSTANTIKAGVGVLKELPAVFKGFGDLFSSWKSTPTPSSSQTFDTSESSYEEYYATNGFGR